jgi:hypothetical protein
MINLKDKAESCSILKFYGDVRQHVLQFCPGHMFFLDERCYIMFQDEKKITKSENIRTLLAIPILKRLLNLILL